MHEAMRVTASQGEETMPVMPSAPVSALIAMSETPNSTPAAAPSMMPWWWSGIPRCLPPIRSAPITSIAPSKAIMPTSE